jgi:hypothetical protein
LQIATDPTNVYFADDQTDGRGRILSCVKTGCNSAPTVLVDGLDQPLGLAADGANVYFDELGQSVETGANVSGRVSRCAIAGCNDKPTALAGYVNLPLGIAVDASHVYWSDFGSAAGVLGSDVGRVMVSAK